MAAHQHLERCTIARDDAPDDRMIVVGVVGVVGGRTWTAVSLSRSSRAGSH